MTWILLVTIIVKGDKLEYTMGQYPSLAVCQADMKVYRSVAYEMYCIPKIEGRKKND